MKLNHWIEAKLRPTKLFNDHFEVDHQFHGMKLQQISESFLIRPKSQLASQLFYEGIHFPSVDLHLKCTIYTSNDVVKVHVEVLDPNVSKEILREVKARILLQLRYLQKKLASDPTITYVQAYCEKCKKNKTKPFNICVKSCEFEPK